MLAAEAEPLALGCAPHAEDDLELLLEHLEALAEGWERHGMGVVLGIEPPGAQTELDAAVAHHIDLGHLDGEHSGEPERH